MKYLFMAIMLCFSFQGHARSSVPLLKLQLRGGPGFVINEIEVYSDGLVTEKYFHSDNFPNGKLSQPVSIVRISSGGLAKVVKEINATDISNELTAIHEGGLNPGGFRTEYILFANNKTITFALTNSGVEFELFGWEQTETDENGAVKKKRELIRQSSVRELKQLLDSLVEAGKFFAPSHAN